ncbi:MAG: class I SAM-dependent methyltransferase [Vicinamibacterales bacterium]
MPVIDSPDYHDYFIKDGRFIGEFEQMYRNVADPWSCAGKSHSLYNDLLLALVTHVAPDNGVILEAGCGLGALAARIKALLPTAIVQGCDVSSTAVEKARAQHPGIEFFVQDLMRLRDTPVPAGSLDVVTLAQVLWCVLPSTPDIMREVFRLLKPQGSLLVLQQFYSDADQKYGRGIVEDPADFLAIVRSAGFRIEQEIYVNRERPLNLLTWAVKG